MVPSSFRISTMTDAGSKPASRARSQPASVWPARTRTPPGWRDERKDVARLDQVPGLGVRGHRGAHRGGPIRRGDARRHPAAASMDTVKAVEWTA